MDDCGGIDCGRCDVCIAGLNQRDEFSDALDVLEGYGMLGYHTKGTE